MEAVSELQQPEPAPSVPTEQEPPVAQAPQLTQEQEQEAKLRARYGGLVPKKGLLSLSRKAEPTYFDSADWALSKNDTTPKPVHQSGRLSQVIAQPGAPAPAQGSS